MGGRYGPPPPQQRVGSGLGPAGRGLTHALERDLRISPSRLEEGGGAYNASHIDLGSYKSCRDKFWGEYLGPLYNFFCQFFFEAVGQYLHGQKGLDLKMLTLLTEKNSFTVFSC